jgi:hypothetical protein
MPDIQRGVFERRAARRIHQRNAQLNRHTRFTFGYVLPQFLVVYLVRANFLFRGQRAGGRRRHSLCGSQSHRSADEKASPAEVKHGKITCHISEYTRRAPRSQ